MTSINDLLKCRNLELFFNEDSVSVYFFNKDIAPIKSTSLIFMIKQNSTALNELPIYFSPNFARLIENLNTFICKDLNNLTGNLCLEFQKDEISKQQVLGIHTPYIIITTYDETIEKVKMLYTIDPFILFVSIKTHLTNIFQVFDKELKKNRLN